VTHELRPEERLLVLLSYSRPTTEEDGEARTLAPDWDTLWTLARENATEPLVHSNLERLGLPVPEPIRTRFRERAERIREVNEARLRIAREVFARFANRRIPVVILKGVLFGETIYRNPSYKKMNDVDILIRKEDLDTIYSIYEEMGFFCAAELFGDSPRKQEKLSHHAPPFFSRDLKFMVGTHWGLITPLAPYRLDYDAIWSRVREIDFYGLPAKSMAPEDNLHHLCVHLPYYKTGVRELADIYNLVRDVSIPWDLFLREVEKAGSENLVSHALSLANRLSPNRQMADALARIEPRVSRYYRRDIARKTESVSRLLRSRCVHMSVIEKAFTDLNSSRRPREKWEAFIRMWRNILLAPDDAVVRMNSVDRPGLWSRSQTPFRIFRVFIRDLGRGVFFLLVLKSILEVIRAPFQSNGRAGGLAAREGIPIEALEQLKAALE